MQWAVHTAQLSPCRRWEMWSRSASAGQLRAWLGSNRSAQLADVRGFARSFFKACLTPACGFKVLPGQIRPASRIAEVLGEVGLPQARGGLGLGGPDLGGAGRGGAGLGGPSLSGPALAASLAAAAAAAAEARAISSGARRILLERGDVRAEFASWRRAMLEGNWGNFTGGAVAPASAPASAQDPWGAVDKSAVTSAW